jgi:hypothetical protein
VTKVCQWLLLYASIGTTIILAQRRLEVKNTYRIIRIAIKSPHS